MSHLDDALNDEANRDDPMEYNPANDPEFNNEFCDPFNNDPIGSDALSRWFKEKEEEP